ncbi:hypothetical protein E4L95_12335 [Paracoccus liaowanqingii]|uniref:Uncharacterized protein n=1 Tax=Paracoccus liaowanqingii TaxID=2560053 RepID=A0A4Z1CFS8_9RHOB|nr:hypothetical protein [Paracoccus liaowanqingii]TGN58592.1 hypothetical protein E4L95_12335 [Paracoccus liaowanqingii]
MQRRDLFKAAPAALFVGALPSVAVAAQSPVMSLFREWQAMNEWLNGSATDGMPRRDFDKLVDARIDIEDRLMAEPAQSASDVVAKMTAYTYFGDEGLPSASRLPQVWAEAKAFMQSEVAS